MKQRGAWFDSLISAADRYVLAMADAPHGDERKMARDSLIELIGAGRKARERDRALLADKKRRREETVRAILKNTRQVPLAEIFAEEASQ